MKHTFPVTAILISMFLITQLIGLAVINAYSPQDVKVVNEEGELVNRTIHNLPYGVEPPAEMTPGVSLFSIVIAIILALFIMMILMKINAALFIRLWFFFVVTLALAITFNAALMKFPNSATYSLILALPLAFLKIFKRNMVAHNFSELFIYPGIAAIFVPILNLWAMVILLIIISVYDIYAVWHAGFMQKMAKYQIENLRLFAGFFVPYVNKKERARIAKLKKTKSAKQLKNQRVKVNLAILGGGDVVFPMILAGVVLNTLGLIQALIIALGATIALGMLFKYSQKGKFYPAMPFITAGCLIALGLAYLI